MKSKLLPWSLLLAAATCVSFAQVSPPDAGQVLNTLRPPKPVAPSAQRLELSLGGDTPAAAKQGPKVVVSGIVFEGNTVFTAYTLGLIIAPQVGKQHDLDGLRGMARLVGEHYRRNGYPFARAIIPVQELKDGILRIRILEGAYGDVTATGEAKVAAGSQPFLSPLRRGELLESELLERTLLILDDVPGIAVRPVVSPGKTVGVGDLVVATTLEKEQGGELGVDNEGSRYTGEFRFKAAWYRNSALAFGDRLSANLMATNANLWLGAVDYDSALGSSGLRGQLGWALNTYELGKEFASLQASGLARVWSARLSYPLIRSRQTNLQGSIGLLHKSLHDDFDATAVSEDKFSQSFPISLRFDHRDGFGGGGIS
jgi:hemolysin activation/secretion protein